MPAFGGAAKSVESVVYILADRFDFTLYELSTHSDSNYGGADIKRIVFKGFRSKRLNTLVYYLKSFLHCFFWGNYDVVHFQHLYGGFLTPLLRIRYKVLTTAHGIIPNEDSKWNKLDKFFFRVFEFLSVYFSNLVVTVSKPHIAYLKNIREKLSVIYIPNGANLYLNIEHKDNSQSYILFSAARIIQLKGLHTLLESLRIINYKNKVVVIGDLEQVPSYKAEILTFTANLNIDFTGLIKEKEKLFEYIKNAKFFIFPSLYEGMSNMLLEVASMKTPTICSDIIENKAIFTDHEVLYFKAGDANSLSEKILWAENNYPKMLELAEHAYQKVKIDYSWENIADKYAELYNQLIMG